MSIRHLNPDALAKPPGYTHVVEMTAPGRMVFIAGQLGLKPDGTLAGTDFRAQAEQAFVNLEGALAAVGGTLQSVVKITSYFVDMRHLPIFREVRDAHFTAGPKPASTAVGISALAIPDAIFEIEAIAVLPL